MSSRFRPLILVVGVNELASAVAHRLFKARFRVVMTEDRNERELRKFTSYSRVFIDGLCEVEGIPARKAVVTEAVGLIDRGSLPVLWVSAASAVDALSPDIVVDARAARPEPGGEDERAVSVGDAALVIAAGGPFSIGEDCDMAVLVERGHGLGRLVTSAFQPGLAPSGGTDGAFAPDPVVRVPAGRAGTFAWLKKLGEPVAAGEILGQVDEAPVAAPEDGIVTGILEGGVAVDAESVVAEIDRRGHDDCAYLISAHSRTISGTILEIAVAWAVDMGALNPPIRYGSP